MYSRCRARDATRLEPLVWFFFPHFFLLFKVYFRSPQHIETSMAAVAATAALARDATRLEPLVYFYIYVYIITLTFIQVNIPTRLRMETSGQAMIVPRINCFFR